MYTDADRHNIYIINSVIYGNNSHQGGCTYILGGCGVCSPVY